MQKIHKSVIKSQNECLEIFLASIKIDEESKEILVSAQKIHPVLTIQK